MKRLVALALVALASASCSAVIRWEKSGVGAAEQQRDETECTARASRETSVPTAVTSGTTPSPVTLDPQRTRIQSYDADVFESCMRDRGYQRVPGRPPG
jgi:hypothetical protein